MEKLRAFQLRFTNSSNGVYQPGQVIQGQLFMDLNTPMKMRALTLQFEGRAKVQWEVQGSNNNSVEYRNDELYFNEAVILWGTDSGGRLFSNSPQHPAGQYVYPFQFQLPYKLPSSFEGGRGWVRFVVRGRINKPWKSDHTIEIPFTIISPYNLNQNALSWNPSQNRGSKNLCCFCCTSGPISATLRINKTGYVPGEFIIVNGEVNNDSNRTLLSTSIDLIMVTTFYASGSSQSLPRVIKSIQRGEVAAGDSEIYRGQGIHIPPLPPSELPHCKIIDIKYSIALTAKPSGPSFALKVPVDIIIGTIPLQNRNVGLYQPTSSPEAMHLMGIMGDSYRSELPLQSLEPMNATPPSFAEPAFGMMNIRDVQGPEYVQLQYAPVYTY